MLTVFRSVCMKFPVVMTILLMVLSLVGLGVATFGHNLLVGILIVAGVFYLSMIALGGMQYT